MSTQDWPVLALTSSRAGLGKSCLALSLSLSFRARGLEVGLVDADCECPDLTQLCAHAPELACFSLARWRSAQGLDRVHGELFDYHLAEYMEQGPDWPELDLLLVDLPPGPVHPGWIDLLRLDARVEYVRPGEAALWSALPLLDTVEALPRHPAWREAGPRLAEEYPHWSPAEEPRLSVERICERLWQRLEALH